MADRILLVEDDERIRSSMRLSFEAEGYEVAEAGSGEEALDLFAASPTDLVLVDLMLTDSAVFPLARCTRKFEMFPAGQLATSIIPSAMLGAGLMASTSR